MVPGGRIEPPTQGFSIPCSTPELPGHIIWKTTTWLPFPLGYRVYKRPERLCLVLICTSLTVIYKRAPVVTVTSVCGGIIAGVSAATSGCVGSTTVMFSGVGAAL